MADAVRSFDSRKGMVAPWPATIKTIATNEGEVCVRRQHPDGPFILDIHLPGSASPNTCQTTIPLNVIEFLVEKIGCGGLAAFIKRHDDKGVPEVLKVQLLNYFRPEDFKGKRLLDFGCGLGASTFGLAKLLPETEVLGIDLGCDRIEIAQTMAALQRIKNVRFLCSPTGDRLPDGIGQFDFVMLSAVCEHLLPHERRTVLPLIWSVMKEGASIFINQTPYRYFPFEHHSSGLWFINYMPDRMAHFVARHFSKNDPSNYNPAIQKSLDWETHLRGGLRGATEWEIVRNLTSGNKLEARIMQPRPECARDRADYWLHRTGKGRYRSLKKAIAGVLRITDKFFGTVPSMNIDVVIRKEAHLNPKSS